MTVLVGCINCLCNQPVELRKRLQIRFEFHSKLKKNCFLNDTFYILNLKGLKIMSVFDELKKLLSIKEETESKNIGNFF